MGTLPIPDFIDRRFNEWMLRLYETVDDPETPSLTVRIKWEIFCIWAEVWCFWRKYLFLPFARRMVRRGKWTYHKQ